MRAIQAMVCAQHDAAFVPPETGQSVQISRGALAGGVPLNGLRHLPDGGASGWRIWSGDAIPDRPGFFDAVSIDDLTPACLVAMPMLALPPGWRFVVVGNYADAWYDRMWKDKTWEGAGA